MDSKKGKRLGWLVVLLALGACSAREPVTDTGTDGARRSGDAGSVSPGDLPRPDISCVGAHVTCSGSMTGEVCACAWECPSGTTYEVSCTQTGNSMGCTCKHDGVLEQTCTTAVAISACDYDQCCGYPR